MKRSEVLKIIEVTLKTSGNVYSDGGRAADLADVVLSRLEKIGMLPPKSELIIAGQTFHDYYWEPENDSDKKP